MDQNGTKPSICTFVHCAAMQYTFWLEKMVLAFPSLIDKVNNVKKLVTTI